MGHDRRRVAAALLAAASAVLAACGSDPAEVTGPTAGSTSVAAPAPTATTTGATTTLATTPDGLAATLEQYREDQITGTIQVQVVNRSTRTVRLQEVRLSWAGFTDTAPGDKNELVGPGQVLDLPVPLGAAVCTDPPVADSPVPAAPAVASVLATWQDGGTPQRMSIPVTDTRGVLPRIYRPDCRRQSVEYVASVAFDPTWTDGTTADGRPAAFGALRLHRRHGTEPVAIAAVNGSVLLTVAPATPAAGAAPLVLLAGDAGDVVLPVVVTQSGRCEAHALAESKHTFFLPAAVAVGSAPVVLVDVIPDDAAKLQLLRMINRSCGVG